MKNEDLYVYKKSEFYEDFISSQKEYYEREEVDTLLAEKDEEIYNFKYSRDEWAKACNQKDKEIAELKQKLENVQASMYADVVDANMEVRRLKLALWLARALRARDIQRWWIAATCAPKTERVCSVWNNVERKCRAMAEKFK